MLLAYIPTLPGHLEWSLSWSPPMQVAALDSLLYLNGTLPRMQANFQHNVVVVVVVVVISAKQGAALGNLRHSTPMPPRPLANHSKQPMKKNKQRQESKLAPAGKRW